MRRWRVPAAGVAAGVLLIAVYLVGFHNPGSAQIAGLEADAEQLRAQQAPLRRDIAALQDVAGRAPELQAALQLLEGVIPSGLAQPTLLVQLQTAAVGAGVKLVSVTFDDPEVPGGAPPSPVPGAVLVTMPFTIVADGSYPAITDMLRRVEVDVDRGLLVDTVALTEADAGFPQLRGTWSGKAYALLGADDPLLVDPEAAPAEAAPPAGQPPAAEPPPGNP